MDKRVFIGFRGYDVLSPIIFHLSAALFSTEGTSTDDWNFVSPWGRARPSFRKRSFASRGLPVEMLSVCCLISCCALTCGTRNCTSHWYPHSVEPDHDPSAAGEI